MTFTRRTFLATLTCALGLRKTGLPNFTAGASRGYVHFGSGVCTMLHGPEMIVPASKPIVLVIDGKEIARIVADHMTPTLVRFKL